MLEVTSRDGVIVPTYRTEIGIRRETKFRTNRSLVGQSLVRWHVHFSFSGELPTSCDSLCLGIKQRPFAAQWAIYADHCIALNEVIYLVELPATLLAKVVALAYGRLGCLYVLSLGFSPETG